MLFNHEPLDLAARAQQKARTDIALRCFCCRDSALIIDWVLRRYGWPDYTAAFDAPILCRRYSCNANKVWVDVEGTSKQVVRYNPDYLDCRFTPEECEAIHQAELERIKQLGPQKTINIPEAIASIAPTPSKSSVEVWE